MRTDIQTETRAKGTPGRRENTAEPRDQGLPGSAGQ